MKQGFVKQIQREVKAHPLKAGVLGLALVIALWFWAPLLMNWMGVGSKSATPAAAAPATPQTANSPAVVGSPSKGKESFNPTWREMVDWHKRDSSMRPAELSPESRDPFRAPVVPQSVASVEKAAAPKIDPASLGLELTGTLIGPRQSVAMINGRAYILPRWNLGDRRPTHISIQHQTNKYEFALLSIEPDSVQLEFQGQPFQLRVRDTPLENKKIELNEKSTVEIHTSAEVQ